MNQQKLHVLLYCIVAFTMIVSCGGTPPAAPSAVSSAAPPASETAPEVASMEADQMPPGQDALDELSEAMARADSARVQALDAQGNVYCPDEWNKAEAYNVSGRRIVNTLGGVKSAIELLTSAAEGYESIETQSLAAKDMEDAQTGLAAAIARAEQSRKTAMDNEGPIHFPDDWAAAEAMLQEGADADKDTSDEIKAAIALYEGAADEYDDIAARSLPLASRVKDAAQNALNAAIARAEKSRQQAMAVDGPTYFANDWRAAEARNQSAQSARKSTVDEMQAATALYIAAADAYDAIAQKSAPMFAKDKDDASKALQAAITRATQSRTAASNAKAEANFPTEWRAAETRKQTADNAKRGTTAEMKAATPLYTQAADAYDDIVRKNTARVEQETQIAKANAEKERQAAINAKAPVAAATEYNRAETLFQQATKDFNAKAATATERFNQSTPLFTAATQAAEQKRVAAESAIAAAKEQYAANTALRTTISLETEAETETDKIMSETARLIGLAEEAYAQGQYDDAIKYAQDALKNTEQTNDYLALQIKLANDYLALQAKIKEADDAIAAAQDRLDWAKENNAPRWYAEPYGQAVTAFAGAQDAYSQEDWEQARDLALSVLDILADMPEGPVFAAQYLVQNWVPMRDCLWNIAEKPEIYGDPLQWRRIYTANRSKFPNPDNPDILLPGTLLDIPNIGDEIRIGILEGDE